MTNGVARLNAALSERYRVERELGEGGMATVYLAEDLKHSRKVAIKVLKPELAAVVGAERFLAEIRTTANLQHPNILPLYDSGRIESSAPPAGTLAEGERRSSSLLYYVMPYVEGESLRDALKRERQLSVEDTVSIARSAAGALQYAHDHGVVHRDIKPENILLQAGQALVADFGVALAITQAGGHRLTETGLSIGTPAYMSPEQASGEQHLDGRSDVYALGCVVYEMLVGEPPFTGPTAQAVIARAFAADPAPLGVRRKTVPPDIATAVHRALQKLPADRFRSAKAFAEALGGSHSTPTPVASVARGASVHRLWIFATAALAVLSIVLGVLAARGSSRRIPGSEVKIQVSWPAGQTPLTATGFALSPDGRLLAYLGPDQELWLRKLDELTAHPVPGTARAENPFFSPDGRSIAFFTRSSHSLSVVPVDGGPVRTLVADSADVYGGDWTADGMVYYVSIRGDVRRVPAAGGSAEQVSRPDSAGTHLTAKWVNVLPNGRAALVSIWRGSTSTTDVGVLNLKTGRVASLFRGTDARYVAFGYVVYATPEGRLVAAPFDEDRLAVTGAATPIADSVLADPYFGRAQFAVSGSGTLLYKPINAQYREELAWVTPDGAATPVDTTLRAVFNGVALSPDGQQVAVAIRSGGHEDVWVKNLKLGSLARVSLENQGSVNFRPQWTADGRSLTFISDRAEPTALWIQPVDGSAPATKLVSDPRGIDEGFLTPDSAWIVYRTFGASQNDRDIFAVPVGDADTTRVALAAAVADEYSPALSPNGRWLAYVSEESGHPEVYVRPFPGASTVRWLVSVDGGIDPVWDHSGRRLFYKDADLELMEVDIAPGAEFTSSPPRVLFNAAQFSWDFHHPEYTVTPDDKRFLMVRPVAQGVTPFVLVLNWVQELKARVSR